MHRVFTWQPNLVCAFFLAFRKRRVMEFRMLTIQYRVSRCTPRLSWVEVPVIHLRQLLNHKSVFHILGTIEYDNSRITPRQHFFWGRVIFDLWSRALFFFSPNKIIPDPLPRALPRMELAVRRVHKAAADSDHAEGTVDYGVTVDRITICGR